MADYGFAIKKSGVNKDVTQCSVNELSTSSKFNCFKIALEGTTTITWPPNGTGVGADGTVRAYVSHGLNFTPTGIAFVTVSGKTLGTSFQSQGNDYTNFDYYATSTQMVFELAPYNAGVSGPTSSYYVSGATFTIKYFIFGDTANQTTTTTNFTSGGNYGMKIMKPGYDADTDNAVEHIIWSTRFPPMKVHSGGTTSQTTTSTGDFIKSIPHGLSYTPAFIVLMPSTSGGGWSQMPQYNDVDGYAANAWSDGTNLYFEDFNPVGASGTISYKYVIFAEKATS